MAKTRQQKEAGVGQLVDKLNKAKSVVFADYRGLNMKQLSQIRNQLSEQNAEFTVIKNSLLKLAFKASSVKPPDSIFQGPLGTVFVYDEEIRPITTVTKALKEFARGSIKGGLFEGGYIEVSEVQKLASLPSKEELMGKLVGGLGASLYGMLGVLSTNLRNLVFALDQIIISKGGERL